MNGFSFVGGPLDGQAFDHHQINAVAEIVAVSPESGNRAVVLMPPLEDCERILRGELFKDQLHVKRHPYELTLAPGGMIEYRDTRI